jgi:hypothetical protein
MTETINKMVITIDANSELDDAIIIPQGWRFSHLRFAATRPLAHRQQGRQHWDLISYSLYTDYPVKASVDLVSG